MYLFIACELDQLVVTKTALILNILTNKTKDFAASKACTTLHANSCIKWRAAEA